MRLRITILALASSLFLNISPVFGQAGDLTTGQQVLAGTEWRLVSLGRFGAESLPAPGSRITLKFGKDGRVGGSGGCNSYGGSYQVQGDRLTFYRVFSTKRACIDPNANRQESQYFAALESANRFRLLDKRLSVYYSGGQSVLDFVNDAPDTERPRDEADGPVSAVNAYYRAINAKDYERAHRYWEAPSQTLDQFVRGFADTAKVTLLVDPSPRIEGAAGSSYANVSVVLITQRTNGVERIYAGCYEMRKSNVRPEGGSAGQGWKIYRANVTIASLNARVSRVLSQLCRE
jgi:putative lipoprotein